MLNGLAVVNIELTSRCNKECWMCGRRKMDRDYPDIPLKYGDMDFELAEKIADQLPYGIVVQLHNNGEPLLYPRFGDAAGLFYRQIRCVDTNGKLIVQKADEIIGNLETMTISVFENDPETQEQLKLVKEFISIKGQAKPRLIFRCLGAIDASPWEDLGGMVVRRILHNPMGSFGYKKQPTIPETGICMEVLCHPSINRFGDVSVCVRFDPNKFGVLGNLQKQSLDEIWNGDKRREMLRLHIKGERNKAPLCSRCEYWGIPTGQHE